MPPAFARILVPLRAERMLALDPDVVVIDKPDGFSTHAPDLGDDATGRVREALIARDGSTAEPYLGVMYTLDRDASGVLLFTRRRTANAALARQFESGTAGFTLVAAVAPWPARAGATGVLHARVKAERGGVRALSRMERGGRDAELRYTVLARKGPRALLRLEITRGPLGQVPAQLEALGCAVAGDRARGGAAAARRMLHLESLAIRHPNGRDAVYRAPIPTSLESWVSGDEVAVVGDDRALDEALARAAERRHALVRDGQTTAYRLVNDAGDGVPGVTVDAYGEHALVQFYTPEGTDARERVLDAVARAGAAGVYAKYRPKQSNTLVDTRRDDLAPAHALRGEDAPEEFTVRELGLTYRVRLGDGLSTGIFLDQRENRRQVRAWSRGATVLNLFAYTAPFTVAAAAGGAASTVSVDASAGALAWAARNLEANGLAGSQHALVTADVFGWLEGARARGDRYDVIVLDPPSYSTTRDGSRFSSESDYRALATSVLGLLRPGGRLLACSNHRGISSSRFRRHLSEAATAAGFAAAQLRELDPPSDFPPAPGHEPHLKSVLITVAPGFPSPRSRR